MPTLIPETMPVEDPTTAIAVELLLHVPPGVLLLSVVVLPLHTSVVPVIAAGNGFTVTVAVVKPVPIS